MSNPGLGKKHYETVCPESRNAPGISDYFNDITVKRTKSEFPVFVML